METNTNENFNIEDNKSLGYIKLFRSIENWEWYDDMPTFKLFVHCLLRANHQPREWRGIKIDRGQFVTSYEKLAVGAGLTKKQVRTAIKKLKSTGEVAHEGHTQYSVITVNNYDLYQEKDTPKDTQETNERQSKGNQRATNKNYKNEKNDKNDKSINAHSLNSNSKKFIKDPFASIEINTFLKEFKKRTKKSVAISPDERVNLMNAINDLEEQTREQGESFDFKGLIKKVCDNVNAIKPQKLQNGSTWSPSINWLLKNNAQQLYAVFNQDKNEVMTEADKVMAQLKAREEKQIRERGY